MYYSNDVIESVLWSSNHNHHLNPLIIFRLFFLFSYRTEFIMHHLSRQSTHKTRQFKYLFFFCLLLSLRWLDALPVSISIRLAFYRFLCKQIMLCIFFFIGELVLKIEHKKSIKIFIIKKLNLFIWYSILINIQHGAGFDSP